MASGLAHAGQVMSISDAVVVEGDTGQRNAVFTVSIPSVPTFPETVFYQTLDGTATAADGDFIPVSGILTFQGTAEQTVSVPVLGDRKVEPDEMFKVEISQSSGAVIVDPFGDGTILNDDTVRLSVGDTEVLEGDQGRTAAVFTATLDAPSAEAVTARFATADGSATVADGDYPATSGMLRIPAGTLSTTFTVPVNGDLRSEPDETFEVVLGSPMNATLADNRGVATILDDDEAGGGTPEVSIGDVALAEGDEGTTEAVFTVTLSQPSDVPVTVAFATMDGSATTQDGDYLPATGTVVFEPGTTAESIAVEVMGDPRVEPDETFLVVLSDPNGATLGDAEGEGTILNDDEAGSLPTLSIGDAEVREGNATGSAASQAFFQVTLSAPASASNPVTFTYSTADGTATLADGDYAGRTGQLTFPDGATSVIIGIGLIGDTRPEPDETFFVDLSEPTNATIADGRGQATILDDDLPEITIGDATVVEGDGGTTQAAFPVTLRPASPNPVSVAFTTLDGSARAADGDYQARSGEVGFAAGQTEATILITVNGDTLQEGDETFFVNLSDPNNAELADAQGQGTIRNDDVRPGSVVLRAPASVAEGAGSVRIEVELTSSGPALARGSGPSSVRLTATPGTATAGEDFTPLSRTLTWEAGESGVRAVRLPITDDLLVEGNETILLRLSEPTGLALGNPASGELVIVDDDTAFQLRAEGDQSLEAVVGDAVDLRVVVTQEPGGPVAGAEVQWQVDGDATLGDGATTISDEDGTARQRVQLGSSAGQITVTARVGVGEGQVVVFEIRAQGNLAALFEDGDSPGGQSVAMALDDACTDARGELAELCRYLLGLEDAAQQRQVLEELLPKEVAAQVTTMFQAAHEQLNNLRARQADLRSHRGEGEGSSAVAGLASGALGDLTVRLRGEPIRLASLAGASGRKGGDSPSFRKMWAEKMLAAREGQEPPEGSAKGGDGEAAGPRATGEAEVGMDFSRLGLFVNGSLSVGDRPTTGEEAGFDFETTGVTAGLDYRLSDRLFFGGAVGWVDTRADVVSDGGRMDVTGFTLLAYGTYYWKGLYVDVVAGYGSTDYDGSRNIDLAVPLAGQNRFVASSAANGSQLSGSLRVGYDRQVGATTLQGFADLSVVDLTVDAYNERGGGPFALAIGEQNATSLLATGGLEAARAFSVSWGVLRPMVRGAFVHELQDDARQISARFTADGSSVEFVLPTEAPDRHYFNLAAGLTATLVRGRTLYLTYDKDVGRDDLDTETVAVGFRLEL